MDESSNEANEISGISLRVAVCAAFFPPAFRGGGPIRTVGALVSNAPDGVVAAVFTSASDLGSVEAMEVPQNQWVSYANADVRYVSSGSLKSGWGALCELARFRPDVLYLNSLFSSKFSILPLVLVQMGFLHGPTIVLAPRGELGRAALALKHRKKRVFLAIFKILNFDRNILWHASSERELVDIRLAFGENVRYVVRENDSDLPPISSELPDRAPGPLRAVNVARIVPIKGLKSVLESLREVRVPLSFDIYGPEEDAEYSRQCRDLAKLLPENIVVNFNGEVSHSEVRGLLANYDVMIFPTEGENFGHVIAEALSVGCPVICADVTPWTSWLTAGAGVVVENTPSGWIEAVESYASQVPEEIAMRRVAAATAYRTWRQASSGNDHLFELVWRQLNSRS